MTNDGNNTLVYDGENRTVSATNGGSSGAYVYDGNGLRVKKCVPNCTSPTTTTVYLFSGSKVVAEYVNGAAPSAPTKEYIYSGAQLLATLTSSSTTYHHGDHLSVRVSTDTSGNKIADQGHFPYGETWYFGSSGTKWQFTTYERDAESGNDYALARYNVNRLGRFSSPDPLSGSTADPQSLNRYSYVRNMPVTAIDPSGMYHCITVASNYPDETDGQASFRLDSFGPSDADPDPQPQQSDCANSGGGGGGFFLDGGDNTDNSGSGMGFGPGQSGGLGGPVFISVNILNIIGCSADAHGCLGYWTTGLDIYDYLGSGSGGPSGGNTSDPQKPNPKCNRQDPTNAKVLDFIRAHRADAQAIASQLNVPVQNILGLSAQESAYGTSPIAQNANNYFGLHSGAPGSTGTYTTSGGVTVSSFSSTNGYSQSGQAFAIQYGHLVSGKPDPQQFANSLVPRFNTANAKTGGNPQFVSTVTGAISAVSSRINCP